MPSPTGGIPEVSLDPWLGIPIALGLVALNGFFVAAEFAIVKVRLTQIEPHAARGDPRGRVARHLVEHLDAYLSATQLGITLASLALGWIGEPAFAWLLSPILDLLPIESIAVRRSLAFSSAFVVITFLHILLGELAPKSLAIRKAEPTTLWVAIPLFAFYKLTYPAIWALNHSSNAILRAVGIRPVSAAELEHSEDELRLLLASSQARVLSTETRDLLDKVFELAHRVARQVMVRREDVVYLSLTRPMEENLRVARSAEFSRFPLCDGDLDRVVGMVHARDLVWRGKVPKSLLAVKRPMKFVPESMPLDRLLDRMQNDRLRMVAVVDEHGGVSGIVSLEDVLEEVVGPIQDEFDQELPDIVQVRDGVYHVSGTMLVIDLERALELELSERAEDTVAGLVLTELGRSPRVGDRAAIGAATFEVLVTTRRCIRLLEVVAPHGRRLSGTASEQASGTSPHRGGAASHR